MTGFSSWLRVQWDRVGAVGAALVAARQTAPWNWVATWLAEGGIAAGISVASLAIKAHLANVPLVSGPIRKLILSFSPAMIAARPTLP